MGRLRQRRNKGKLTPIAGAHFDSLGKCVPVHAGFNISQNCVQEQSSSYELGGAAHRESVSSNKSITCWVSRGVTNKKRVGGEGIARSLHAPVTGGLGSLVPGPLSPGSMHVASCDEKLRGIFAKAGGSYCVYITFVINHKDVFIAVGF